MLGSNPGLAAFSSSANRFVRLPEFSGKELETLLVSLIHFPSEGVVPVSYPGCGPDITQHTPVDLAGLVNRYELARKGSCHLE